MNLNEIIQYVIREMEVLPENLIIETDYDNNLMNIKGGGAQIHRIITNMINNARDAMQDVGNIRVKTENYYADNLYINYTQIPKGEYVKLTITDVGCGIPEEIRQSIFDPFFTTKTTDKKRGSGLGLSVVDAVVKDHNGFIDLKSKMGEGTSFYLYFPTTRENTDIDVTDAEIIGGTENILVVDDDSSQCTVTLSLLKKLGYNARAIENGEEAIEFLKDNPQDLLILDMIMPGGIDGTEIYRRALKINPEQRAIIVSGFAESNRVDEAIGLGVDMYLRKPLTMRSIAPAVRKSLDQKAVLSAANKG